MTKLSINSVLLFFLLTANISAQTYESFTDSRDGKTYRTIKIGDQVWMAENLKFKDSSPQYGEAYVYKSSKINYNIYGRLYPWESACKVCPEGWHLPSKNEWYELINNFGDIYTDKFLTSTFKEYRKLPKEERKERKRIAKDAFTKLTEGGSSGFNALFGGYFEPYQTANSGSFDLGSVGHFWTTDKVDDKKLFGKAFSFNFIKIGKSFGPFVKGKRFALSVRCVKNIISIDTKTEIQE